MEQTGSCQAGEGKWNWRKEVKGLAKEHIYITHRHRQQCGGSQRERGVGAGEGRQRQVAGKGTERDCLGDEHTM